LQRLAQLAAGDSLGSRADNRYHVFLISLLIRRGGGSRERLTDRWYRYWHGVVVECRGGAPDDAALGSGGACLQPTEC